LGKVRVNITVEEEVIQKAKDLGLNISKMCENCLKEAIKRLEGSDCPNNKEDSSVSASSKEGLNWSRGQELNLGQSGFCAPGRLSDPCPFGRRLQPEALPG